MNENIDLTEILAGCPVGTEFYHLVFGTVCFAGIEMDMIYPIKFTMPENNNMSGVTSAGLSNIYYKGECVLFPSKDQRDWSKFVRFWDQPKAEKFDMNTLQPFDRVLARCKKSHWTPTLFGFFIDTNNEDPLTPFTDERVICVDVGYHECVPYNDDTKHLIGTMEEAPDFYKWWEE